MGDGAKGRVVKGYFHREDAKRTEENRWFSDDVVGARRPHLPQPRSPLMERGSKAVYLDFGEPVGGVVGFWRGRVRTGSGEFSNLRNDEKLSNGWGSTYLDAGPFLEAFDQSSDLILQRA